MGVRTGKGKRGENGLDAEAHAGEGDLHQQILNESDANSLVQHLSTHESISDIHL